MAILLMPDEATAALEDAGFRGRIEGESLIASLQNRAVHRYEVAQVFGCETEDLDEVEGCVRVNFASEPATASATTTKLYDRRNQNVQQEEIERIRI